MFGGLRGPRELQTTGGRRRKPRGEEKRKGKKGRNKNNSGAEMRGMCIKDLAKTTKGSEECAPLGVNK